MNLFAYGTLIFPEVWSRVVGGQHDAQPAVLPGYMAYLVRNDVYPVLVAEDDSVATGGLIYFDLNASTFAKLDRFESDIYARQTVEAELVDGPKVPCEAYVLSPSHEALCTEEPWNWASFGAHGLEAYLSRL